MIAGLETITAGDLYIGAQRVNEVDPRDRNLAFVFQNYALFPHMTVAGNLSFGMRIRGHARRQIEARVQEVAGLLGIGELLARKPGRAVRRATPAGSARPGADPRSGSLSARRAALQSRRQVARQHADRADQAAPPARPHRDPRHPRSGRGHDHGRADLHHERRADRPGGRPDGGLSQSGRHLRRRFPCQPADEPAGGTDRDRRDRQRPCRGLQRPTSAFRGSARPPGGRLARSRGDPRHPTRGHPRGAERSRGRARSISRSLRSRPSGPR